MTAPTQYQEEQAPQVAQARQTIQSVKLGLFTGGLNNAAGTGDAIQDDEVFDLVNLEVDLDGSLTNRPAINSLALTGMGSTVGIKVLGVFLPADGRVFIAVSIGTTLRLIDPNTGTSAADVAGVGSVCCTQYGDRLWFAALPGSGSGGYFTVTAPGLAPVWVTVAAIPNGEAIVVYKERLWVASGLSSTTNSSRLFFSAIGVGSSWGASDFIDIEPGNGQKLVYMLSVNNDIILFKQHSSFRFTYASSPANAEVSKISSTIGVPSINCAVMYDNNSIYVLHDNNVYELFNYSYARISRSISLRQIVDPSLYAYDIYGLTLYRDRLFIRYYSYLYVYSLTTKTWSRWSTTKQFSRIVFVPSADIGLDTAYASSASSGDPGKLYYFRDDRVSGVGTAEVFDCTVITKTYDFDQPQSFKVLKKWGASIATSGNTVLKVTIPNTSPDLTWGAIAAYTWGQAKTIPLLWGNSDSVVFDKTTIPSLGKYGRKFLKAFKKLRFRQAFWTITTTAIANSVADSSVRIYDITVDVGIKQDVVKETS